MGVTTACLEGRDSPSCFRVNGLEKGDAYRESCRTEQIGSDLTMWLQTQYDSRTLPVPVHHHDFNPIKSGSISAAAAAAALSADG